jgi:hypothetical protein
VDSSSFWTTAVQHRALREAIALANKVGQTGSVSTWTTQAGNILCFLQSYWSPNGNFITANTGGGRQGVDANTLLTSIHTFDPNAGCDATTFQPCSDKALINLMVYVNMFRSIYPINSGVPLSSAAGVGRYKEDVYQGGNVSRPLGVEPSYLHDYLALVSKYIRRRRATLFSSGNMVQPKIPQHHRRIPPILQALLLFCSCGHLRLIHLYLFDTYQRNQDLRRRFRRIKCKIHTLERWSGRAILQE